MAAFANGLAVGADGIELDVHLSRDNVVVVHHDATVDRTTAGRGAVESQTAAELARLDVPTLADVLTRFRDTRVIVEMKLNARELAAAVETLGRGKHGVLVGIVKGDIVTTPLAEVAGKMRPADASLLELARTMAL